MRTRGEGCGGPRVGTEPRCPPARRGEEELLPNGASSVLRYLPGGSEMPAGHRGLRQQDSAEPRALQGRREGGRARTHSPAPSECFLGKLCLPRREVVTSWAVSSRDEGPSVLSPDVPPLGLTGAKHESVLPPSSGGSHPDCPEAEGRGRRRTRESPSLGAPGQGHPPLGGSRCLQVAQESGVHFHEHLNLGTNTK